MTSLSPQPTPTNPPQEPLRRVLASGRHATSFQILEEGIEHWIDPQGDGVVGFVDWGFWRVVAGPPIAPPEDVAQCLERFVHASHKSFKKPVFFGVDDQFLKQTQDSTVHIDTLCIGEQPEWTLSEYHTQGSSRRSLRAQINRAKNKGVRSQRAVLDDATRADIKDILSAWRATRRMDVMGFTVDVQPFHNDAHRRTFIAYAHNTPVAFLIATPIPLQNGWFFENIIRTPNAPNGTTEHLIDFALRSLREDGAEHATLGLAPLSSLPKPNETQHPILTAGMQTCADTLGPLYQFQGLRSFKARMRPNLWTPQYIATPHRFGLGSLLAVLIVFANKRPLPFALETLRRLALHSPHILWACAFAVLGLFIFPWLCAFALFARPSLPFALSWLCIETITALSLFAFARSLWHHKRPSRGLTAAVAILTACNLSFALSQALPAPSSLVPLLTIALIGPLVTELALARLSWTHSTKATPS